jgi:hypothetical protein
MTFTMTNEEFLNYLSSLEKFSPESAFFLRKFFVEPFVQQENDEDQLERSVSLQIV